MDYYLLRALIDLVFAVLIFVMCLYIFLIAHSLGAWELPYVPTSWDARRKLKEILKKIPLTKDTRVLDLGSGLGRMVIFFARYPVQITGIELKKLLHILARIRMWFHPFKQGKIILLQGDFFQHDLSKYDIIYCFHITKVAERMAPKMAREMKKGAIVISNTFYYPLSPDHFSEEKIQFAKKHFMYVYTKK